MREKKREIHYKTTKKKRVATIQPSKNENSSVNVFFYWEKFIEYGFSF